MPTEEQIEREPWLASKYQAESIKQYAGEMLYALEFLLHTGLDDRRWAIEQLVAKVEGKQYERGGKIFNANS